MRARAGRRKGLLHPIRALSAAVLIASCASHPAPAPGPVQPALQFPPPPARKTGTEALPAAEPQAPVVHQGATAPARTLAPGGPSVQVTQGGDVTLNFADADIREVVRAVLGDVLGLNYYVDSKVQGTVTVETTRPLPRAAVLPALERILRASGAALVQDNGLVRVMPLDTGDKGAPAQAPMPGSAIRLLPLQYVTADQIQKIIQPFVPLGASLTADSTHNVLVLSGSREDMDSLANLVRSFDTDWLARMSFALVPLRNGTAEAIASQMREIVAGASGGESNDTLRIVPVAQLEAVLVITTQPRYLAWAQQQIELLDSGAADSAERTYIYHVQYGRANDLTDVLTRIFGPAGAAAAKPAPSSSSYLEPASSMASLSSGFGTAGGTSSGTAPSTGLGAAPAGSPLAQGAPASTASTAATGTGTQATTSGTEAASPGAGANGEGGNAPGASTLRFVTDARNNAIVIVATPRQYRRIEEALKRLDVKPMQVEIAATIAEVTLNDQLQFGLQWFFRQHNNSEAFSNTATSTPGPVFPGFSYSFLLSDASVNVVLNALSAITNVNVVSAPQLLVLNNQTAQLQVGQQVPVPVEQQQSTLVAGAPLVNTINYVNTGVILSVTPRANATGEVTLDIEQEVSDVATVNTGTLNAPTLDERRIKSTVSVDSGESVALGGLISNSVTKTRSSIPLLGQIPLLGALFRNDDNTTLRTELLVLIEPRIINGADDARAATDELERRMHDIAPLPPAFR
jgi:general secretion pathway protein D